MVPGGGHARRVSSILLAMSRAGRQHQATYSSFPNKDRSTWMLTVTLCSQAWTSSMISTSLSGGRVTVISTESVLKPSQTKIWEVGENLWWARNGGQLTIWIWPPPKIVNVIEQGEALPPQFPGDQVGDILAM